MAEEGGSKGAERAARESCYVIEKPVVRVPIVALFRTRRYIGASLLLSLTLLYQATVSLSLSLLSLSPARRNKKNRGKKSRRKREARADVSRGEKERVETGETKKDRTQQQCPRRCILARLPTRRGLLTNGFVNHERFKVITHRKKES